MEDALVRDDDQAAFAVNHIRLNPCFNGRCTSTAKLR